MTSLIMIVIPTTIKVEDYSCPSVVVPRIRALKYAWIYKERVYDRNVEVTFAANEPCDDHFRDVIIILKALLPQTKCNALTVRITILLSDHKKVLPTSGVLDKDNVNTGYARRCNEIVVYRKEEWKKVLVHEFFHYFEFDMNIYEDVARIFPVPVRVDLKETFCEVWARIIHCSLSSNVETCLKREREWACFQMVKVLDYMGLTYDDLLNKTNLERYKENTNVFAYIVLGAILLQNPRKFMFWSKGFNAPPGLDKLIEAMYQTPFFLRLVAKAERTYVRHKRLGTDDSITMRMSL